MKNIVTIIYFSFLSWVCVSQTLISKQQATEDLDFYLSTLMDVHYNPFLLVEKDKFMAEAESIKKNLPDSVALESFILSLYKLSALMKDSHSGPAMYQGGIYSEEYKKPQFFPLKTFVEHYRLYIPAGEDEAEGIPPGSEVISINGKNMEEFLKKTQPYVAGIEAFSEEMTGRLFSHFLFLSGIKAPFTVEYISPTGEKDRKILENGLPYVNALILSIPALVDGNSFEILDNNVGYIDFSRMNDSPEKAIKFMDSAFAAFTENNVQHLAIDLRNNSGGNSIIGEILFGYITDNKFTMQGGKLWKVSKQYKEYLLANGMDKEEYLQKEVGSIWEKGDCKARDGLLNVEDKFKGKVYMLIGPFTFSSGNMVADTARNFKIAELVGEPTGEFTTDFGEVYTFALPNSGILINFTTSFDIGTNCDRENLTPVIPDVHIPAELQDKLSGKDRALEYVMEQARQ